MAIISAPTLLLPGFLDLVSCLIMFQNSWMFIDTLMFSFSEYSISSTSSLIPDILSYA